MADKIKGITVEIGGDTVGLQKSLKDVNDKSRNLQKELKSVDRLLKFDPDNVEALAQKQELLQDQLENTTEKLKRLRDAEKQVQEQFERGDITGDQYRAFRREVEFTEASLSKINRTIEGLDTTNVKNLARNFDDVKDSTNDANRALDGLKGGLSGLGAAGTLGVGALVSEMQDYNQVLARLRTNAVMANRDVGTVEEAFDKVVAITGEADSAGETIANLLASGLEGDQLLEAVDLIDGAFIKFSDTLKTEGIADGIQETFATGKAVGPFAELVERSGGSLEEFDKQLGNAKTGAEKMNVIMGFLRDQGFGGVVDKYREMNPEVQRNAEAQAQLQKSLAELAVILTPLVVKITEIATKITEWANKNPELVSTMTAIAVVVGALVGICMLLAPVFVTITSAIGILSTAVGGSIAAFLGIVAAAKIVMMGMDLLVDKTMGLAKTIGQKFAEMDKEGGGKLAELGRKAGEFGGKLVRIFGKIKLGPTGRKIIQGLLDGITGKAKDLYNKASEIANGISKRISNALKIKSPSRVTMELGEQTGEGMLIGLEKSISKINSASKKVASAAIPQVNQNAATSGVGRGMGDVHLTINAPQQLSAYEVAKQTKRMMNTIAGQF